MTQVRQVRQVRRSRGRKCDGRHLDVLLDTHGEEHGSEQQPHGEDQPFAVQSDLELGKNNKQREAPEF